MMKTEKLELTQEWDKTYPKDSRVDHSKVTFINRYGITLAADMFVPKNTEGKLPAIAVSGPFGAVMETLKKWVLSAHLLPARSAQAQRICMSWLRTLTGMMGNGLKSGQPGKR